MTCSDNAKRRREPASCQYQAAARRLAGELLFLDFGQFLAVDAKFCGGSCLKAADADLDAPGLTPAVFVLVDHIEGFLDFFQQLAFTVAGAQLKRELFFLSGAIIGVRKVS